jgi:hypothetical protein
MHGPLQVAGIEKIEIPGFQPFAQSFGLGDPSLAKWGIRVPLPPTGQVPFRFPMAYKGNLGCLAHRSELTRDKRSVTFKQNYLLSKKG